MRDFEVAPVGTAKRLDKTIKELSQSLAVRKLEWQLEAISILFNKASESGDLPGSYLDLRNELRRKALADKESSNG